MSRNVNIRYLRDAGTKKPQKTGLEIRGNY
ncbi:MAG: hypothetical protein ACI8Z9_002105 [Paraglaciecola sp.]